LIVIILANCGGYYPNHQDVIKLYGEAPQYSEGPFPTLDWGNYMCNSGFVTYTLRTGARPYTINTITFRSTHNFEVMTPFFLKYKTVDFTDWLYFPNNSKLTDVSKRFFYTKLSQRRRVES